MPTLPRLRAAAAAAVTLAAVAFAAVTLAAAPAAASPAAGLTAAWSTVDNGEWRLATYVVANPTSAPVTGWTLEFDLPAGLVMGNTYHGTVTRDGDHVTVTNAYYNATVPAGGSTAPYSFSFIATGTGAAPANCRVNGAPCDGGTPGEPGEDTTAPAAPTGLRVTENRPGRVTVAWDPVEDASGIAKYTVLRTGGGQLPTLTWVTGTSITFTFLAPGTWHEVTVTAKDNAGNDSPTARYTFLTAPS